MNQIRLQTEDVIIEAHKLALLQQPDPAIAGKPLLRVPSGCEYTADDWQGCWALGKIDFEDQYALSHQGKLPSKENLKACGDYLYGKRLDAQDFHNWEIAWTRLRAADVIKSEPAPKIEQTVQEPQAPKKLTAAEFAKEVAQAMEKIDTRTPAGRKQLAEIRQKYLILEAQPIVAKVFSDLNSQGHYPTDSERDAMLEWIQNHNLVLTNCQSWAAALRALFPKYLSDAERLGQEIDRDDSITSADLKKALGTASPRVAVASVRANR